MNGTASFGAQRALAATPVAALAFVATLALAAIAVRYGLVTDDTLRLWAGASSAADGQVPIGRIVAGYPTLPFLATTLVAFITPAGTPAPALIAAGLYSIFVAFCLLSFRRCGFHYLAAAVATLLIACHPALLHAAIGGPSEMFLAVFLLMLCLALFDLRARSGTSEVMAVGLALMGLAFAHPVGAAVAFGVVPFLTFAVRPSLAALSAPNIIIALIFPTLFMVCAFAYVSWVFPGDGWTFFSSPAESLSLWRAALARNFGNGLFRVTAIDASLGIILAIAIGAPVAVAMMIRVRRRRALIMPAAVFLGAIVAATAISVASGFFGDPTAIVVAAPVLAACILMRVPEARQRAVIVIGWLVVGWLGGLVGLSLFDPIALDRLQIAFTQGASERLDAIALGGAAAPREGVLADTDNAPAFVLGHGGAHGLLGPESEPFVLAMLFARIDSPFIAVPDPRSATGAHDRLDRAFPSLFRDGLTGYRIIYQNNTWRLFGKAS
jgi:membrane protein XagC